MIKRFFSEVEPLLSPNKVLIIYGPRRVGKTTLLNQFLAKTGLKYVFDSGDNIKVQQILGSSDFNQIKDYAGANQLIVIDEAQQIPGIGMGLKIVVDQIPNIKVIATGSSSFDLANQVGEPLTGRKNTIILYPVAQIELAEERSRFDLRNELEERLIFGSYPEVLTSGTRERKTAVLEELVNSYLFKDILSFDKIKKSRLVVDLVKLLALQIGSEVSVNELATQLSVNARTVERYLDLLEKSFIIVSLGSLKRNLRNEVRSKRKYYFLDNGIRNAVISQFNSLSERNDAGALWENFLFMERMKRNAYKKVYANLYYWRTYDQKEIDYIEERDGQLFAYEFKWKDSQAKKPKQFTKAYPNSEFAVINRDNYLDFVL